MPWLRLLVILAALTAHRCCAEAVAARAAAVTALVLSAAGIADDPELPSTADAALIESLGRIADMPLLCSRLGLHNVHELVEPGAPQLANALLLESPNEAREFSEQQLLDYLRRLDDGVRLISGAISGSPAAGKGPMPSGMELLPPALSFPLLRRATVARIAQLRLLHGASRAWKDGGASQLVAATLRQVRLHHPALPSPPPPPLPEYGARCMVMCYREGGDASRPDTTPFHARLVRLPRGGRKVRHPPWSPDTDRAPPATSSYAAAPRPPFPVRPAAG